MNIEVEIKIPFILKIMCKSFFLNWNATVTNVFLWLWVNNLRDSNFYMKHNKIFH